MAKPLNKAEKELKKEVTDLLDEQYPAKSTRPKDKKYRTQVLDVLNKFTDDADKHERIGLKAQLQSFRAELRGEDDEDEEEETPAPPPQKKVTTTTKETIQAVHIEKTVQKAKEPAPHDKAPQPEKASQVTTPSASYSENDTCRRMAFVQFLKSLKDELKSRGKGKKPTCFISYAWEVDPQANKALQERLEQLRSDLSFLKVDVKLDIHNMDRDINKYMVDGVAATDNVLVIGTPRFRERAGETKSNLALEYREALKRPTDALLPLWFSGDKFKESFPDGIEKSLVRDFRNITLYMTNMTKTDNPIGLIPSILKLNDDREYLAILGGFVSDMKLIDAGKLSVQELQARGEKMDAANSAHMHQHDDEATKKKDRQTITATLAEDLSLAEGTEANMARMKIEGVSVELDNIEQVEHIDAVHKNLTAIVEANQASSGIKKLTLAKGAKLDASDSSAKALSFKYNFASTKKTEQAPAAAPAKPARAAKPPKKDVELMDKVKKAVEQALEGDSEQHTASLTYLEKYDNRLLNDSERKHLQQYMQDKILLFQVRGALAQEYEDEDDEEALDEAYASFVESHGQPAGLLTEELRQQLQEQIGNTHG